MDMDWVSRRVKRHLNDLERSNYTEPTSGPGAYGQLEDSEEGKGASALSKDDDGECSRCDEGELRCRFPTRRCIANVARALQDASARSPPRFASCSSTARTWRPF